MLATTNRRRLDMAKKKAAKTKKARAGKKPRLRDLRVRKGDLAGGGNLGTTGFSGFSTGTVQKRD